MKYIAKPNTWFDEGTEVEIMEGPWDSTDIDGNYIGFGLFVGFRNGSLDEESCGLDEFDIVEK